MPIIIKSSIDGFRRAGIAHSKEPTEHADDAFTEAQIKQLKAEPRLSVEITPAEPKANSAGKNPDPQGPVDEERLRELVEHIAGLDKEDESLWKQDKSPKADAFPKGTTAEERTAAWDAYLALDNGQGN